MNILDVETIEVTIFELVQELLTRLKVSSTTVMNTIEDDEGISVMIEPEIGTPLVLSVENGVPVVYLTIGEITTLDIPLEGLRYTEKHGTDELVSIIEGIVKYGFTETTWKINDEIVKTVAEIPVHGEEPITVKTSNLCDILRHIPFLQKQMFVRQYPSYR